MKFRERDPALGQRGVHNTGSHNGVAQLRSTGSQVRVGGGSYCRSSTKLAKNASGPSVRSISDIKPLQPPGQFLVRAKTMKKVRILVELSAPIPTQRPDLVIIGVRVCSVRKVMRL